MTVLHKILFSLLLLSFPNALFAQCPAGQDELKLNISPDFYWQEVTFDVTDQMGNELFSGALTSDDPQEFVWCVDTGQCLSFNIHDSYGDGINPGSYQLSLNGTTFYNNPTGAYASGESVYFNCPPGTSCPDAYEITEGQYTAPLDETWYVFAAPQTGVFQVNTCFPENQCRTKIWVYNSCNNILVTDGNLGTIFYAENGCADDKALANLFLAEGDVVWVRIGSYDSSCQNEEILFDLSYVGPIAGCMDPNACNFQPLATEPDSCFYQGSPNCTDGPDLVINEPVLRQYFELYTSNNNDECEVLEGCTNGYGERLKVRFSTEIRNEGNQDYFIGEVPNDITQPDPNEQFVYDPCHGHWHYRGYAEYLLADANGDMVPIGTKNGFCVLDLSCQQGGTFKYNCSNMGISAGCEDTYDYSLPCQWIDITGLDAGQYTMICRVNWDKTPDKIGRQELTHDNNWGQVCFDLSYSGNSPEMEILDDCPRYLDCEGTEFGNARRDCEGNCNGVILKGDLNRDTLRTDNDLQQYLSHAIQDDGNATECTDLHKDGNLGLYDAALLQECILHENDVQYWSSSFACLFPTGQVNPNDRYIFRLSNLNTDTKTFDISLANGSHDMYGVDLTIDGVVIESVEEINSSFDGVALLTDNDKGRIVALTTTEEGAARSSSFKQLLRVKYSSLTNDTICISTVKEVVNELYELAVPILDNQICVVDMTSNADDVVENTVSVHVFPNPATERVTVSYPDLEGERVQLTVTNSLGQVVRTWSVYNSNRDVFYRNGLPAGIYQIDVKGENGQGTMRVVFE